MKNNKNNQQEKNKKRKQGFLWVSLGLLSSSGLIGGVVYAVTNTKNNNKHDVKNSNIKNDNSISSLITLQKITYIINKAINKNILKGNPNYLPTFTAKTLQESNNILQELKYNYQGVMFQLKGETFGITKSDELTASILTNNNFTIQNWINEQVLNLFQNDKSINKKDLSFKILNKDNHTGSITIALSYQNNFVKNFTISGFASYSSLQTLLNNTIIKLNKTFNVNDILDTSVNWYYSMGDGYNENNIDNYTQANSTITEPMPILSKIWLVNHLPQTLINNLNNITLTYAFYDAWATVKFFWIKNTKESPCVNAYVNNQPDTNTYLMFNWPTQYSNTNYFQQYANSKGCVLCDTKNTKTFISSEYAFNTPSQFINILANKYNTKIKNNSVTIPLMDALGFLNYVQINSPYGGNYRYFNAGSSWPSIFNSNTPMEMIGASVAMTITFKPSTQDGVCECVLHMEINQQTINFTQFNLYGFIGGVYQNQQGGFQLGLNYLKQMWIKQFPPVKLMSATTFSGSYGWDLYNGAITLDNFLNSTYALTNTLMTGNWPNLNFSYQNSRMLDFFDVSLINYKFVSLINGTLTFAMYYGNPNNQDNFIHNFEITSCKFMNANQLQVQNNVSQCFNIFYNSYLKNLLNDNYTTFSISMSDWQNIINKTITNWNKTHNSTQQIPENTISIEPYNQTTHPNGYNLKKQVSYRSCNYLYNSYVPAFTNGYGTNGCWLYYENIPIYNFVTQQTWLNFAKVQYMINNAIIQNDYNTSIASLTTMFSKLYPVFSKQLQIDSINLVNGSYQINYSIVSAYNKVLTKPTTLPTQSPNEGWNTNYPCWTQYSYTFTPLKIQ